MADTPSLHVTDIQQEHRVEYSPEHGTHDVMRTHFTTPSGTRTHVDLPIEHHTAGNVARAIHHHTRHIEQVKALDGQDVTKHLERD